MGNQVLAAEELSIRISCDQLEWVDGIRITDLVAAGKLVDMAIKVLRSELVVRAVVSALEDLLRPGHLLNGQAVLMKGGRPFLRDAMPCAGCRHFKIRMFEHDVALYFSEDGSDWIQHPRGLEVSGFQTNNLGGFSSLKLGVYAKGFGTVRVEDFQYRIID